MASAPRSSGTDSLDNFRDALSKNMKGALPPPVAPPDDDEVRDALRAALAGGKPVAVRALADRVDVPLDRVLRLLGLSPDTSPEQLVVGRTERPARKRPAKS